MQRAVDTTNSQLREANAEGQVDQASAIIGARQFAGSQRTANKNPAPIGIER